MRERNPGFIDGNTFKTVIASTPLVSVDLIIRKNGRILLGKRVNKPARGYYFTLGGRVCKNEPVKDALQRIAKDEAGLDLCGGMPKQIGVFEHFYDDAVFEGVTTHYVNIAYEVDVPTLEALPLEQHDEYRWFSEDELMRSEDVHPYVKDYFTDTMGTVPNQRRSMDGR